MHISILLMEQIIELFIMIFMGFIIVKTGIVKDERSFDCICGIGDFAVSFAVYHFCYGQAFPYE